MPDDVISKIKDRVDVVDLISGYLKLQKSGINYKARCPFHNEKTPSFFISPERQIWHCFGCSRGGDVFGFVKEIDGVEFPEALRTLAAKAGVELKPSSPEIIEYRSRKTKLLEISEVAARFFEKQLWQSVNGKKALDYLKSRGLEEETAKKFRLGFAPDSWNALTDFLTAKYPAEEVEMAGLIIRADSLKAKSPTSQLAGRYQLEARFYDRFRSRIIFPITDLNGQVVGFTGRIFNEQKLEVEGQKSEDLIHEGAKYINTPQTLIYDKSRILYGLDKARLAVRSRNKCLIVEGNMDVIMSHQAGADNVVAVSGTALTAGHLKILKRYSDNLDLCFDADSAGELAAARGVALALNSGFNVGMVAIDERGIKDPADFVGKYGVKWLEYSQKSKPFMEFFLDEAKRKFDVSTALGKKLLTQKLLPFLASISSKIEQDYWLSEIALAAKIKEELLSRELAATPALAPAAEDGGRGAETPPEEASPKAELDVLEEGLLSLLVKAPQLAVGLTDDKKQFLSDQLNGFAEIIGQARDSGPASNLPMALEFAYLRAQEFWQDIPEQSLALEFDKIFNQIRRRKISTALEQLEFDIKAAERENNKQQLASLVADFSRISRELGK